MPRITELKSNYIGKTVKKWMIDADMSQTELAQKIDMSPQLLGYKIKNNSFDYGNLIDIICALNVPDEKILKVMKK